VLASKEQSSSLEARKGSQMRWQSLAKRSVWTGDASMEGIFNFYQPRDVLELWVL